MLNFNSELGQIKIILLFALINTSVFTAFRPSGGLRLIIATLLVVSGVFLTGYFVNTIKRKLDIDLYFKIVIFFLVIWSFYTVLRSMALDSNTLITLFGNSLMGWAWLTPLAISFGLNIFNWLHLFNFFSRFLLIASIVAMGVFFYVEKAFAILDWMVFLPILLLTYSYQSKANKRILLFSIVAFLLLSFFASKRANLVYFVLVSFFYFVEYLRSSNTNLFLKATILLGAFTLGVFVFLQDIGSRNLDVDNKEVTTDTRTFLFEELYADMTDKELITGRGVLGTYFSPYFEYTRTHGLGGDNPTRISVEVGYLQIILKGGYIMMGLYLLILLPAAYLGIFKSNNCIARMSGYFILSYLLLWTVSYYPVYSANFILLWMAAGTAISRSARRLSNEDLLRYKSLQKMSL